MGGDTTRGQQTVISVQVIGDVTAGKYITRAGASAGDHLFVTGTPGDAAGGLALLQNGDDDSADTRYLIRRFSRPTARVAFGTAIADFASAAIDLSDGLFGDAQKLITASGAGAELDLDRLPLSVPLRRHYGEERALQFALGGGDDYELCFTAHSRHEAKIQAIGEELGLPVTRIGTLQSGSQLICRRDGQEVEYESGGYKHF
ncbi:MAG TPA: thiamine-phosphate kinase [Woeseiaceae bacterium]